MTIFLQAANKGNEPLVPKQNHVHEANIKALVPEHNDEVPEANIAEQHVQQQPANEDFPTQESNYSANVNVQTQASSVNMPNFNNVTDSSMLSQDNTTMVPPPNSQGPSTSGKRYKVPARRIKPRKLHRLVARTNQDVEVQKIRGQRRLWKP